MIWGKNNNANEKVTLSSNKVAEKIDQALVVTQAIAEKPELKDKTEVNQTENNKAELPETGESERV